MGVFYCPLCRLTAFTGRRHLYSGSHQQRLREALGRLQAKVQLARKMIKNAVVVKYEAGEHEQLFWCLCCKQEVKRHLSHGSLTVLHGGLLQHMASLEHKKEANKFWWENKAEAKLKQQFLISPEDYERFKSSLVKALDAYEEKEDEVIKEMASHIREVEQSRQEMVHAVLEPQTGTEFCDESSAFSTPGGHKSDITIITEEQLGPSMIQKTPDLDWMEGNHALTFIGHQESEGKGNVHTGAKPPWLLQDEEEFGSKQQIGPSYEEFLKEKEKQKLKKLPADRVGANFDHTSQTGEGWLPSFGRVWNHGRRWQSRHQFKAESIKERDSQRKTRKRPKSELQ
ncbi:centrosomal AT-AC splicing factor isoform X1 [Malaclemys terrapin pileata]|uniref:centrosomal AT-AC splicing factor isoform X1 n=1 Tax=Malaclemys terrapin pileata TaxID=2991368 RepID=UPI0023A90DC9|nr:centrosomal AT-AC splicing factor isoform X1 [Malaclemys terrapin pileata]